MLLLWTEAFTNVNMLHSYSLQKVFSKRDGTACLLMVLLGAPADTSQM